MTNAPEWLVAQEYMHRKGYEGVEPVRVTKLENDDCWYFEYELPEGLLELEVAWDESEMEWDTTVTAFVLTGSDSA